MPSQVIQAQRRRVSQRRIAPGGAVSQASTTFNQPQGVGLGLGGAVVVLSAGVTGVKSFPAAGGTATQLVGAVGVQAPQLLVVGEQVVVESEVVGGGRGCGGCGARCRGRRRSFRCAGTSAYPGAAGLLAGVVMAIKR